MVEKKQMCAYCGDGADDLRPCPACDRLVCWHPTCRNGAALGKKLNVTMCCTCAGKLPETSEGNPDWTNGTCPICDKELKYIQVVFVMDGVKANKYQCAGGHVALVADYGNSERMRE